MALTKVSGHIIDQPFDVGIITATNLRSGVATVGTMHVTGNLQVDGTTTTLDTVVTEVDKLEVAANNSTVGVAITQSGTGDIFNLYDGATEVFTVTDGGKVGIGTVNVVAKVDVVTGTGDGTQNEANCLRLRNRAINGNAMTLQVGVNTAAVGGFNQGYAYLQACLWGGGNNPILLNAKGGNVGIGRTSAHVPLDVNGDTILRAAGNTTQGDITRRYGFSGPGSTSNPHSYIAGVADKTHWYQGLGLVFGTVSGSDIGNTLGVERMRISSDGNVGIGSVNPSELLHLQSGWTKQILKSTNLNTASYLLFDTQNVNTADFLLGRIAGKWNGNDVAYIQFEAGADTTNKDDGVITFLTSSASSTPAERLRIQNDGKIGIGTATPNWLTTIQGGSAGAETTLLNLHVPETDSNTGSILRFSNSNSVTSTYGTAEIRALRTAYNTGYTDLIFTTSDGNAVTEKLRIKGGTGNVGIGTDSPGSDYRVTIKSSTSPHSALLLDTTESDYNTNLYFAKQGTNKWTIGNKATTDYFRFVAGSTEVARITSDGNFSIPTDSGKITVGVGSDLQIYHDGSNSYIDDTGTGRLNIRGNTGVSLRNYSDSEQFINCYTNGIVEIFHDNSKKLETTSTGVKVTGAVEVTQEYPSIRPTLDLNFAATKRLDRRITFTRDSVGTYVDENGLVKYASNNVPRFDHDPTTHESLGLLIEEARTNINKVSTFRASGTGNDRFSVNSASEQTAGENTNGVIGPDGTAKGVCRAFFTGSESNPGGSVYVMASTSSSNGADFTTTNTHTSSVWIRPGLETVWKLNAHTNYASASAGGSATTIDFIFTLTGNGTVTSIESGGISASVAKYPNNWYRCTITYHRNSTASVNSGYGVIVYPNVYTNYSANSQTGDIGWFWGPQVEEGAFPTSYIPTSGTTVTRNQEFPVIKGTHFTDIFDTNFNEFSILVDYDNTKTFDGNVFAIIDLWGESTNYNDRIEWFKDNSSPYHIETRGIGNGSALFSNSSISASSKAKAQRFASSWYVPDYSNTSSRRFVVSMGGEAVDVISNNSGSAVPQLTRMGIGCNPTRLDLSAGLTHFKKVVVYNKALPDAQLQGLTQQ